MISKGKGFYRFKLQSTKYERYSTIELQNNIMFSTLKMQDVVQLFSKKKTVL